MKRAARSIAFVLALASGAGLSACSLPPGGQMPNGEDEEIDAAGGVLAALQLEPGVALATVGYTISGPSAFSKTGTLNLQTSTTLSALISPIPAGVGFLISLNATATDGATTCAGSAPFDVAAHQTTPVLVHLVCHEGPRQLGSATLSGDLNICPYVARIVVGAYEVFESETTDLVALGVDLDAGPAALAYHWTTDLGTLTNEAMSTATFRCTAFGVAHITVSVSDGDPLASCAVTRSTKVDCVPPDAP